MSRQKPYFLAAYQHFIKMSYVIYISEAVKLLYNVKTTEKTLKNTWQSKTVARQKMASLCPNITPTAQPHRAWPSAQCAPASSYPPHTACSSPLTVCSSSPHTPSTTVSVQHIQQCFLSLEANRIYRKALRWYETIWKPRLAVGRNNE